MILLYEHIFDPDDLEGHPKMVAVYDNREKAAQALKMAGYTELDHIGRFHHEDPRRLFMRNTLYYSLKKPPQTNITFAIGGVELYKERLL